MDSCCTSGGANYPSAREKAAGCGEAAHSPEVLLLDEPTALDRGRVAAEGSPADTVTADLLTRVLGIAGAILRIMSATAPFVLPHSESKTTANQSFSAAQ